MTAKILVVDDEPDVELLIRLRYRKQIGSGEYAFVFARNGEEALRELERDDGFAVVLTDLNMPVMDGLVMTERVRANPRTAAMPVLMVTTESSETMREKGRAAGATGWITKPYAPQKLVAVMRRICQ